LTRLPAYSITATLICTSKSLFFCDNKNFFRYLLNPHTQHCIEIGSKCNITLSNLGRTYILLTVFITKSENLLSSGQTIIFAEPFILLAK